MRDRRVRQHALEVGLRQRDQVADHERGDREPGDQQAPVRVERADADFEQAVGHAERGQLRRRADEQRDRRRRALVDVRQPHVERRGAELERDADDHEHQAGQQQRRSAADAAIAAWMLRRDRACRSRRTSSTCRTAAGPRPANRARSTSSPLRRRARCRGRSRPARTSTAPAVPGRGTPSPGCRRRSSASCRRRRTAPARGTRPCTGRARAGTARRRRATSAVSDAGDDLQHVGHDVADEHAAEHRALPARCRRAVSHAATSSSAIASTWVSHALRSVRNRSSISSANAPPTQRPARAAAAAGRRRWASVRHVGSLRAWSRRAGSPAARWTAPSGRSAASDTRRAAARRRRRRPARSTRAR